MAHDKLFSYWNLAVATVLLSIAAFSGSAATSDGGTGTRPAYRHFSFRHYRATAYINLLSITIFSRADVGGGYASVEETGEGGREQVVLKFVSGSSPERAHGLNRLGLMQEVVRAQSGEKPEDRKSVV